MTDTKKALNKILNDIKDTTTILRLMQKQLLDTNKLEAELKDSAEEIVYLSKKVKAKNKNYNATLNKIEKNFEPIAVENLEKKECRKLIEKNNLLEKLCLNLIAIFR